MVLRFDIETGGDELRLRVAKSDSLRVARTCDTWGVTKPQDTDLFGAF